MLVIQILKAMRRAGLLTYENNLFFWTVDGALHVKRYAGQNPEDWAREYLRDTTRLFGEVAFKQMLDQLEVKK